MKKRIHNMTRAPVIKTTRYLDVFVFIINLPMKYLRFSVCNLHVNEYRRENISIITNLIYYIEH